LSHTFISKIPTASIPQPHRVTFTKINRHWERNSTKNTPKHCTYTKTPSLQEDRLWYEHKSSNTDVADTHRVIGTFVSEHWKLAHEPYQNHSSAVLSLETVACSSDTTQHVSTKQIQYSTTPPASSH